MLYQTVYMRPDKASYRILERQCIIWNEGEQSFENYIDI